METIRLLVSIAASQGWKIEQMDVKSGFLNGYLEEEVYVTQPEGYDDNSGKVLKLKKALYGLKQAPRAWYKRLDDYLHRNGYIKSPFEHALYVHREKNGGMFVVCIYVDDLIMFGSSEAYYEEFKRCMRSEFEMTELGSMSHYLGIEVVQSGDGIFMCQRRYASDLLKKYGLDKSKPIATPLELHVNLLDEVRSEEVDPTLYKSLVGSLRYLTCT